jgi:curli biogenesis system outer membrane secretion channel CsgG
MKTILILILCVFISGCVRSNFFRNDEDHGSGDTGNTYYSGAGSSAPTKKVEALGQPKKRIVVINFWNDTPVRLDSIGAYAADELRHSLYMTQKVIVPPDVKSVLSSEDFVQGDQIKVAQLIREGRRLGVAVLVMGRITKVVFRQKGDEIGLFRQKQSYAAVEVEAKLFDVQGGREILASSKGSEASSSTIAALDGDSSSPEFREELTKTAVKQAIAGFVPEILKSIEKMIWQGRVAKVSGNHIYVNAGRASGLISGDILKVMSPGDDVYDPESGAYLGRAKGAMKGTVEVVDFIGVDGSVTEVHTGGNFREEDVVMLY